MLKPVVLPEILEEQYKVVRQVVQRESVGPQAHLHLYDKYIMLVNRQAELEVEQFLHEKHSFKETVREVTKYQSLANEIQYHSIKVRSRSPSEQHTALNVYSVLWHIHL